MLIKHQRKDPLTIVCVIFKCLGVPIDHPTSASGRRRHPTLHQVLFFVVFLALMGLSLYQNSSAMGQLHVSVTYASALLLYAALVVQRDNISELRRLVIVLPHRKKRALIKMSMYLGIYAFFLFPFVRSGIGIIYGNLSTDVSTPYKVIWQIVMFADSVYGAVFPFTVNFAFYCLFSHLSKVMSLLLQELRWFRDRMQEDPFLLDVKGTRVLNKYRHLWNICELVRDIFGPISLFLFLIIGKIIFGTIMVMFSGTSTNLYFDISVTSLCLYTSFCLLYAGSTLPEQMDELKVALRNIAEDVAFYCEENDVTRQFLERSSLLLKRRHVVLTVLGLIEIRIKLIMVVAFSFATFLGALATKSRDPWWRIW